MHQSRRFYCLFFVGMILLLMSIPAQSSAAQSAPRDCTRPTAGNATALAQILDANGSAMQLLCALKI